MLLRETPQRSGLVVGASDLPWLSKPTGPFKVPIST